MVAFRERVGADLLSLNMTDLQSRVAALDLEVIDAEGHATDLFSNWANEYLRE